MGLPKGHRLRRRQDFSRIYQQGSRFRSGHLTLRALRRSPSRLNSQPSHRPQPLHHSAGDPVQHPQPDKNRTLVTRIGISISLKVDKRAVVRNRIRRQLQASFREFLPQIRNGWDLLVVVHPQSVQCDYPKILQELKQLLVDAEVLNGY